MRKCNARRKAKIAVIKKIKEHKTYLKKKEKELQKSSKQK